MGWGKVVYSKWGKGNRIARIGEMEVTYKNVGNTELMTRVGEMDVVYKTVGTIRRIVRIGDYTVYYKPIGHRFRMDRIGHMKVHYTPYGMEDQIDRIGEEDEDDANILDSGGYVLAEDTLEQGYDSADDKSHDYANTDEYRHMINDALDEAIDANSEGFGQ